MELHPDPACKLSAKPVRRIPLLCVQWKTPDNGQRNCPKHVEFYSKNKFEKLVHLVGFIIRKISCSGWNLNLDHLAHSSVTKPPELSWFPHHNITVNNDYLLKPINHLFCVMEIQCIFCEVRTGFLHTVENFLHQMVNAWPSNLSMAKGHIHNCGPVCRPHMQN